jgi:hypothetical protein
MDLSFTLTPRGENRLPKWAVSLADIKAAAEERRYHNAPVSASGFLRGQDDGLDAIHVLACNVTTATNGLIDTVTLGGSFNPLVARQLMVGKIG